MSHGQGSDAHPLKAVIVDLDGTMVDTLGDFIVALGLMLSDLALPSVGREFVERAIGKGSEHLITLTLAEVGASGTRFDAAWSSYQRHYEQINGRHAVVFEGVESGLQKLADAGFLLACLTNKPTVFAKRLLEAKGMAHFFLHTFGGEAFTRKKPDPMPIIETCRALGVTPAQTLMVGDSSNDAAAARAAGCRVALVTYGYNHGEPVRTVDADGFIDRLDELGELLRELRRR